MSDKVSLHLDWCSHEAAKYAVEHWHYSGCMPAGKTNKIGVWENAIFIGCVIFSRGANNTLGNPYKLSQLEVCELTRIAMTNHKTPISRIIKIALNMLKKYSPGLRLVISFADPEHGHHGGIYQATNWIYCGDTHSADEYLVYGERLHGRSMRSLYGTHLGKDFIEKIRGSSKHRYLMPLDAAMRAQIEPLRKPYPKRGLGETDNAPDSNQETGGASPTSPLSTE